MNTMVFAIGSFGSKILLVLLNRLYTHNIVSDENSTRALLENTAYFLIPIVGLCISDAVIRYGLDREYDKREIFTSACIVQFVGMAVTVLLSPLLNLLPYAKGYTVYLLVYIFTSILRSLMSQFIRAREMVRLYALDGILATLTLFGFNILFISILKWGVAGFMLSVILSDLCSVIFLFFVAKLWQFFDLRLYNPDITRLMLRFAIPMIPTNILWVVTGFSDQIFIRYLDGAALSADVGASAAGVYSAATKVPNLINMVSTIFFQAWNMSVITEYHSKDRSVFYTRIFSAYQSIMFLAAAFLISFVQPISSIVNDASTDPAYARAYVYTPVLVIGVLMMSFNQLLSSIYTASQKTSHSFWTSLAAAAVNLILNVVLIYRFGVHGAVFATFASYFVCYIIRIADTRRLIPFGVNHLRFYANLTVLFIMSYIAINHPPYWIPIQAGLLLISLLLNFKELLETAKKVLKRK